MGVKRGRGSGRGKRVDAVRNRRRVVETAHRLFSERGTTVSIREVAKEAGVGVGTIYRHFPDKESLLVAVVEERFISLTRRTREAMDTLEPWEAFVGIMRLMAEMMTEDRAFGGAIASARRTAPGDGERSDARKAREEMDRRLREMAEKAKAAGELRKDVETKDLGLLLVGVAVSLGPPPTGTHSGRSPVPGEQPEGESPERPWERYLEVVLDGLRESSRGAADR